MIKYYHLTIFCNCQSKVSLKYVILEWERECYLKAICNWTPFAELAESEAALRSVAEHPGISVRHFGRFRDELLKAGEEHHRSQVCYA